MSNIIEIIKKLAKQRHDGHFTIMSFTTGYKAMFGTPTRGFAGQEEIKRLANYVELGDCLVNLAIEEIDCILSERQVIISALRDGGGGQSIKFKKKCGHGPHRKRRGHKREQSGRGNYEIRRKRS